MVIARSLALVALVALLGSVSEPALAQSRLGAFTTWNAWWLHPTQGTLGISWDGSVIRIDTDGDGTTESVFARPPGIPDAAITSLRLTPSRTIVYAFGGACNAGNGTLVHFHRLPSFGGTRLDPIVTNLCIPNGIDRFGFYDTGRCAEPNGPGAGLDCNGHLGVSPQRIAFFMTAAEFGYENFVWVDLVSGATAGPAFDFSNGIGFIHVSPSGTQALIQHDLPQPGETDYRLVDLCPGTLGTVVNQGGFPLLDVSPQVNAEVTEVSGADVTIEVGPAAGPAIGTFDFSDCLNANGACCTDFGCYTDQITATQCAASSFQFLGVGTTCAECPEPPVLEACCFESGQPLCDRLTTAACTAQGGDPQPGVSYCSFDTCPTPQPVIALGGPTIARVGDTLTYVLDYENEGGAPAPLAEIEIQLPYGASFDGADHGGDFDGATVRWQLGTLAPGASGAVSFTFTLGCDAADTSIYLQAQISYATSLDGSSRLYGSSESLFFGVEGTSSGPVTVTLESTPSGDPLHPGDTIEHAITLSNANAETIAGVQVGSADSAVPTGIAFGNATSFASVIDAAGGTVDTSSNLFAWTGNLPAGATRTIRFATSVNACVPGGVSETSLGFGAAVAAFDQCDERIGESDPAERFAVESLVEARIAATNLAPPQHLEAPIIDIDVQVARPNAPVDVTIEFTGTSSQALPGVTASANLRGMTVTTPPSGPGVSWNPTTRELAWTGTIPASGSIAIPFQATLAACRGEIDLDGATSPACAAMPDIRGQTTIAAVPEPPAGPWLAALGHGAHPFYPGNIEQHVLRIDPGPPAAVTTMLCLPSEYSLGIGASPAGDVWVSWLPTYRINPRTLDFQAIDLDRVYDSGVNSLNDIGVDPVDGSVYFVGNSYGTSGAEAAITRYDPTADTFTPFFADSAYDTINSVAVDAGGSLALLAYVGGQNLLGRVDPAEPETLHVLYDPPSSTLTDVAVDRDGSYLVIDGFYGTPTLYDVDADTGDRETVVADLRVPFPSAIAWGQLEAGGPDHVWLAPYQPGLGRIDRAAPDVGEIVRPFAGSTGTFLDIAMVGAPEPSAALLAAAAIAALAMIDRRGLLAKRRSAARTRSI